MYILKNLVLFLLTWLSIPFLVGSILKITGKEEFWGIVSISFYFVIFYYNGLARATEESDIGMHIPEIQLPIVIKWFLFLNKTNRFSKHTIIFQVAVVVMTIFSLVLIFLLKIDSDLVANIYLLLGLLIVGVAIIFGNIYSKKRKY